MIEKNLSKITPFLHLVLGNNTLNCIFATPYKIREVLK